MKELYIVKENHIHHPVHLLKSCIVYVCCLFLTEFKHSSNRAGGSSGISRISGGSSVIVDLLSFLVIVVVVAAAAAVIFLC